MTGSAQSWQFCPLILVNIVKFRLVTCTIKTWACHNDVFVAGGTSGMSMPLIDHISLFFKFKAIGCDLFKFSNFLQWSCVHIEFASTNHVNWGLGCTKLNKLEIVWQHLRIICTVERVNIVTWNVAHARFAWLRVRSVETKNIEPFTVQHVNLVTQHVWTKQIPHCRLITCCGIRVGWQLNFLSNHCLKVNHWNTLSLRYARALFHMFKSCFIMESLSAARTSQKQGFKNFFNRMMQVLMLRAIARFVRAFEFLEDVDALFTEQTVAFCALSWEGSDQVIT